ncbi:MAG: M24 family metallopeptidase [Campylobacterales bacterium]|nr:M24 family metallopeptidase [Campylobacterales bacterium]
MNSYILKNENAQYYECGYSSDNAIFLRLEDENYFITDSRYTTEAKEHIKNALVVESNNLLDTCFGLIKKKKVKKLIIDPKEWSILDYEKFNKKLKIPLLQKVDFSQKRREIKSEDELEVLKEAIRLGKEAFSNLSSHLNSSFEKFNEKKLNFLAQSFLTFHGEYELSFEPILAINENGAKPHAKPSYKMLKHDDLLLFDGGLKYKRYCSDRTRTVFFNDGFSFDKNQTFKDKKIQKAYDTVRFAQDVAIKAVKAGVKAKEIDLKAREVIDNSEFKGLFTHSTGHGIGLDIHEYPYIRKNSETVLKENMIFTIEPGIYIPNEFGIRIEDVVIVKENGVEVLSD